MVELLKLNPDYTFWGPGEDYMTSESFKSKGWSGAIHHSSWSQFEITPNDLNVIANFYFRLHRAAVECKACGGTGYAPDARRIADAFYAFESESAGPRWCDAITLDEAQALVDAGRIRTSKGSKVPPVVDDALVRTINEANRPGRQGPVDFGYSHDGINRCILVDARCKRLGYEVECPVCSGKGTVFTESAARVQLVLWLLHPRKGASRGCQIENIQQADLPAVYALLRLAAEQNAQRFGKIPASP